MEEITVIQNKIYEIRGQRVMLDFDLAKIYQVETKVLKQAVRRNIDRFPADFMFEITNEEYNALIHSLRSQTVTSNKGGIRYMPFAFTEMGVAMLSSILRSNVAIQANIAVMRAFVAMRNYITSTKTVTAELAEIRAKLELLERNDEDNAEAINDLSEDMRKELDNIYDDCGIIGKSAPSEQTSQTDRLQSLEKITALPDHPKQAATKSTRTATIGVRRLARTATKILPEERRIREIQLVGYLLHRHPRADEHTFGIDNHHMRNPVGGAASRCRPHDDTQIFGRNAQLVGIIGYLATDDIIGRHERQKPLQQYIPA